MAKEKFLALLRGVNVGGKNKLPMKELVAVMQKAGFEDVITYIQSGNIIFSKSISMNDRALAQQISALIKTKFGLTIPAVVRSESEMSDALKAYPYFHQPDEAQYIMYLQSKPAQELIANLDATRFAPDEFQICGSEIFLSLKTGAARTKLTNAYFDSRLKTVSTSRNLKTSRKLLELLSATSE